MIYIYLNSLRNLKLNYINFNNIVQFTNKTFFRAFYAPDHMIGGILFLACHKLKPNLNLAHKMKTLGPRFFKLHRFMYLNDSYNQCIKVTWSKMKVPITWSKVKL